MVEYYAFLINRETNTIYSRRFRNFRVSDTVNIIKRRCGNYFQNGYRIYFVSFIKYCIYNDMIDYDELGIGFFAKTYRFEITHPVWDEYFDSYENGEEIRIKWAKLERYSII